MRAVAEARAQIFHAALSVPEVGVALEKLPSHLALPTSGLARVARALRRAGVTSVAMAVASVLVATLVVEEAGVGGMELSEGEASDAGRSSIEGRRRRRRGGGGGGGGGGGSCCVVVLADVFCSLLLTFEASVTLTQTVSIPEKRKMR